MSDHSDMKAQAKRTAESRKRAPSVGERRMMASFNKFYEAMAELEEPDRPKAANQDVQTKPKAR